MSIIKNNIWIILLSVVVLGFIVLTDEQVDDDKLLTSTTNSLCKRDDIYTFLDINEKLNQYNKENILSSDENNKSYVAVITCDNIYSSEHKQKEFVTGKKYTFQISQVFKNGDIKKLKEVSFYLKPSILMSKEAVLIYIIFIGLILYINFKKVKKLDKLVELRNQELIEQMDKNTELLNKIIETERNKNNYFINLSHELRTPLNVISSVEQLITNLNKSDKGLSKEKIDEYMNVMNKNIKRLLNLINNIIDTTKIENGKYKINLSDENIVYIVEETSLGLKDAIESSGINLIIDTDVEEKIVKCDSYEIERCIINLLSNASKFTPKGGTIKVDIKDLNEKIKITVEDTGIGIDEKYHKSIFDRFNQIVDKDMESKGGSGLGLTITKHIIDMHNGEIYVESEKEKGTKFTIILPVD